MHQTRRPRGKASGTVTAVLATPSAINNDDQKIVGFQFTGTITGFARSRLLDFSLDLKPLRYLFTGSVTQFDPDTEVYTCSVVENLRAQMLDESGTQGV